MSRGMEKHMDLMVRVQVECIENFPAGSYGYLAGVSAACSGTYMSLQFTWRAFVFPGELELSHTS